jgi:pimeloyl-ACP methyl ester carboxylesterase
MKPVVLIHGYSAESLTSDHKSITDIYGNLPQDLHDNFKIVEIDLSRYLSLNDAVTIQDIAFALNRVLTQLHANLLQSGFHVIVHSTGALVVRTWIQLFSPKPSPIGNLIYLAGANFGSGWASVGQGQIARWGRFVFEGGAQRGVKVLQALELGSSDTIDTHLYFTQPGSRMLENYKVQEFVIVGTQADPAWFTFPVRYAHEDGSDGTVRVSASNLNFNHISIGPTKAAAALNWLQIQNAIVAANNKRDFPQYYELKDWSYAEKDRPAIPFGIPYQCAHTGDKMGIVSGSLPKEQVQRMLKMALETPERSPRDWSSAVAAFAKETDSTYQTAKIMQKPGLFNFLEDPRNQYDSHSQVVVRLHDQNGIPVPVAHSDVYFVSNQQDPKAIPIQKLIEDTSVSGVSPNCILFYLRVSRFDAKPKTWVDQLASLADFALEITAIEPATPTQTPLVSYLPLRIPLTKTQLTNFVQPHRTTIIDVELARVPSPDVSQLMRF